MRNLTLMRTLLTGPLLVSLATAPAIHAGQVDEELTRVVADLEPGQRIRVQVYRYGDLTGKYVESTTDTIVIVNGDGEHRLPQRHVAALWLGVNGSERGAKIGAGAGLLIGIVGGLVGVAAVSAWESEGETTNAWPILGAGAGIGTLTGTVLGIAAGSMIIEWRLLYKAHNYHEAIWSECDRKWPSPLAKGASRPPLAARSPIPAEGSNPSRSERIDLRLGADANGRFVLAATLDF